MGSNSCVRIVPKCFRESTQSDTSRLCQYRCQSGDFPSKLNSIEPDRGLGLAPKLGPGLVPGLFFCRAVAIPGKLRGSNQPARVSHARRRRLPTAKISLPAWRSPPPGERRRIRRETDRFETRRRVLRRQSGEGGPQWTGRRVTRRRCPPPRWRGAAESKHTTPR